MNFRTVVATFLISILEKKYLMALKNVNSNRPSRLKIG
jgi:hypothetical protein